MISLIQFLLIISILFFIYYFYRVTQLIWKLKVIGEAVDRFPMDDKHWLKGHYDKLSGLGEEGLSYFSELVKKYPKACGVYFINFLKPYVMVHHPDTVKVVMKAASRKPTFLGFYRYGIKWLGDGLVLSNGEKWRRNRKMLTPAFHSEALKHHVKTFNRTADVFLENILSFANSSKPFEIQDLTSKLALGNIIQCAFSYKSEIHFYAKATNEMAALWMKRYYEPWKHFDFIYWMTSDGKSFLKNAQTVCEFAATLIRERRNLLENQPEEAENYHDFLNILLRSKDDDGMGLTDGEIIDEINNVIFAGFDTTSSAISWALYNLALNPSHQIICQKEIDDILQGRSIDYLHWKDLQKMSYLTICIKESMRLYSPPFIEKELEEDVVLDGKFVPVGSTIGINLYNLHHNPEIWEFPLVTIIFF